MQKTIRIKTVHYLNNIYADMDHQVSQFIKANQPHHVFDDKEYAISLACDKNTLVGVYWMESLVYESDNLQWAQPFKIASNIVSKFCSVKETKSEDKIHYCIK